jgi:membrane associated rhomboid family serine protease
MIPLRDVIPSRTFPAVTITIIALNAVVFLYELTLSDRELLRFAMTWGLVPAAFSWVTVVTSMFLHGGWMHVIGNMLFLWIFGDNVEDRVGHGRYIVFYLICGAVAALAQTWSDPTSQVPTIGASGAVAGVMGGYFVLYPQSRILTLLPLFIFWQIVEVPAVVLLGFWFVLQLFSGVGSSLAVRGPEAVGGIAFWAHVAGFIAGVLLINVFKRPERSRVDWWDYRN